VYFSFDLHDVLCFVKQLRVVVLLMHGIIVKIVSVINNLPVYWLLLRLFHSDVISGKTVFKSFSVSNVFRTVPYETV
jgi:hypothetical protein